MIDTLLAEVNATPPIQAAVDRKMATRSVALTAT